MSEMMHAMNDCYYESPIAKAKQYAREAILEAYPTALEISEPQEGMYEFDAVYTDDEGCGIASVSIMHDPDSNTFALVLNPHKLPQKQDELVSIPSAVIDPRNIDWDKLAEEHEIAYFRGDLATSSPQSYTLGEKIGVCNDMISTSKAALDAMRADFEQLPADARSKLLGMLCQSGVETPDWWWDVLVGEGDPLYRKLESI